MADAAVRVTGTVIGTDTRDGVSTKGPWVLRTSTVIVGNDIAKVTLSDKQAEPVRGEQVDWYCHVRRSGNFLNLDYVSEWKADFEA